jgi:hypothetical protein
MEIADTSGTTHVPSLHRTITKHGPKHGSAIGEIYNFAVPSLDDKEQHPWTR